MEIIKTICPRCFKIWSVPEDMDRVRCSFCEYDYDLPKADIRYNVENNNYLKRYTIDY